MSRFGSYGPDFPAGPQLIGAEIVDKKVLVWKKATAMTNISSFQWLTTISVHLLLILLPSPSSYCLPTGQ